MSDLPTLWREQQSATFPASALRWVSIDVRAGAALTASLRSDGVVRPLPEEKLDSLRRALAEAAEVLKEPLDVEARRYFERLLVLGKAVAGGSPPATA